MRLASLTLAILTSASLHAADIPAEVTLRPQGHGDVLADAKGMTLYTHLFDLIGQPPVCDKVCLEDVWVPLVAPEGAATREDWTVVERDDATKQWAFRGKPLYAYKQDSAPGDMFGDEVGLKWYIALRPAILPPGFGVTKTQIGHLLIDQRQMSLYVPPDTLTNCDAACLRTWKPIEAWWTAVASLPGWSVVTRPDGTRQWAFKGKPIHRYVGDSAPGEILGAGVEGWTPVVLEPPSPQPSWVTAQLSDAGELLADADGRTLYVHNLTRIKPGYSREWEVPHQWRPVLAKDGEKSVGQWAIVSRDDGSRQWTFKGMALYTHIRDTTPGGLHGSSNTDRVWQTIMASGLAMPGAVN
ncbi:MAG: hypothetical protein FJX59_12960 [Alphaproteobacteria bacterium]|nr:hypothetical protein [Alphaproteobacteria bacterium]